MSDTNEVITEEVVEVEEVETVLPKIQRPIGRPRLRIIDETLEKKPVGRPRKPQPDEPPEKKPRGRPRVENPCIAGYPKDPDYYKNYYIDKLKGVEIPCPTCGVMYSKVNLTNHKRTNKCVRHVQISDLKSQLALLTNKLNAIE